ncbi:hypothetical protein IID62_03430 [candidate division KSB1 bacterium]|nr:hypothetical protein [candidate division KSB1 bacterium]
MTKTNLKIIIFAFLLNGCSGQTGSDDSASNDIIENALTFELSFGDKDLPDEYLLAFPLTLAVNDQGQIFVIDEDRIKVYDDAGNPENIIGRPGQGPGEFRRSRSLSVGYSGNLSVIDSRGLSLFSPDHRLLSKGNLRLNEKYKTVVERDSFSIGTPVKSASFEESDLIIEFSGRRNNMDSEYRSYYFLLYDNDGNIRKIAEYMNSSMMSRDNAGLELFFRGAFLWTTTPEEKVVYLHPDHDKRLVNKQYLYKLHITSLDDFSNNKIEYPYSPVAIPDSVKKIYSESSPVRISSQVPGRAEEMRRYYQYMNDKAVEIIEEEIFLPPLQRLLSDGNFVFAFTYRTDDAGDTLVDVFDMTTDS